MAAETHPGLERHCLKETNFRGPFVPVRAAMIGPALGAGLRRKSLELVTSFVYGWSWEEVPAIQNNKGETIFTLERIHTVLCRAGRAGQRRGNAQSRCQLIRTIERDLEDKLPTSRGNLCGPKSLFQSVSVFLPVPSANCRGFHDPPESHQSSTSKGRLTSSPHCQSHIKLN